MRKDSRTKHLALVTHLPFGYFPILAFSSPVSYFWLLKMCAYGADLLGIYALIPSYWHSVISQNLRPAEIISKKWEIFIHRKNMHQQHNKNHSAY